MYTKIYKIIYIEYIRANEKHKISLRKYTSKNYHELNTEIREMMRNQIKYLNSTVNTRDDEVHFVFHVNKYVFFIFM